MRTLLRTVAAGLLLIGALVTAPSAAFPHDPSTWYDATGRTGHWDLSKDGVQISWAFTPDIPNDALFKQRIQDGATEWNQVSGANRNLNKDTNFNSNFPFDSCPDDREKNGVHWGEAGGGGTYAAAVIQCADGQNDILNSNMQIDDDSNWYTGIGTPGSNQMDTWSVARHEFGHFLGFDGHWDGSGTSSLCDYSNQPVNAMCAVLSPGDVYDSLGAHEQHTFVARY